ncbi:MAG: AAA family ATPase [Pirellulaceae bacterium]
MFESFFGFTARPFAAAPQADRYFAAESIEHARQTLARAIERAEGPAMVVGPAGTGKTLLCQVLAEQFADSFRVATLSGARLCTRRALLQNILFELGLPYRDMEEGELRLSLMDHLEGGSRHRTLLLIVDEAHTLPMRLLEELRLLTNLIHDGQPRVRLLLAGGPALEEHFANPKLESFNQRLAARCYLHSFSRDESFRYVRWQIDSAGANSGALVRDDALQAAYTASDGIPRLLNQVFDHALFLAAAGGHRAIDGEAIQEAWADLQQLPTPWSVQTPSASGGVIEFGELDDDAASLVLSDAELDDAPLDEVATIPHLRIAKPDEPVRSEPARSEPARHEPMIVSEVPRPVAKASTPMAKSTPAAEKSASTETIGVTRYAPPVTHPEVEVTFHDPIDPFGDFFAEEEVVVDHYASLEARKNKPKVVRSYDTWNAPLGETAAGQGLVPFVERTQPEPAQHPKVAATSDEDVEMVEPHEPAAQSVPTPEPLSPPTTPSKPPSPAKSASQPSWGEPDWSDAAAFDSAPLVVHSDFTDLPWSEPLSAFACDNLPAELAAESVDEPEFAESGEPDVALPEPQFAAAASEDDDANEGLSEEQLDALVASVSEKSEATAGKVGGVASQLHRLRSTSSRRQGRSSVAAREGQSRDDRDMVVVAEREAAARRLDQAIEKASKQNYRQLFAKLRNG